MVKKITKYSQMRKEKIYPQSRFNIRSLKRMLREDEVWETSKGKFKRLRR